MNGYLVYLGYMVIWMMNSARREPGRRNRFEIEKDGFGSGISKRCYPVGPLDESVKLRLEV